MARSVVQGNALACFRQVNDSDVLILLELGDYPAITRNTIQQIQREFPRQSMHTVSPPEPPTACMSRSMR